MSSSLRRSFLYTPADDPELMEKGLESPADAVIFDLEDSIADDSLADARGQIQEVITDSPASDVELCVRINGYATDAWLDDLLAVADIVDTVVLPKVESEIQLETFAAVANQCSDAPPELIATLESPRGLFAASDIAMNAADLPSVTGLTFGFADYTRSIGAVGRPAEIRRFIGPIIASSASLGGLDPLYTVYQDYGDLNGLRETAQEARELGYIGLKAIHPAQLPVINEIFTPTGEEVTRAQRFVETFDDSDKNSISVDGEFLDPAIVDQHRAVLRRHRAISEKEE